MQNNRITTLNELRSIIIIMTAILKIYKKKNDDDSINEKLIES